MNEVIRKVASRYADQGVSPLDAVGALSADSRIPGQESFYEHVHLNFDGTYRLARALAEQVAGLLPPTVTNAVKREWASADLCGRRLALTDWNRHRVYEMVLNRVSDAPFTNQSNFLSRQTALGEQMNRLQQRMNAATLEEARATCREAIARAPDDFFLHRKFAELLETAGDPAGALTEWQRVRELLPHHPIAYFQLGRLLAREGKGGQAREYLEQAVQLRPDFVEALDELGRVLARQGRNHESIARYRQALELQPEDSIIHFHLADALAADGKRAEALVGLREAIRLRPGFWEARYLLGVELALEEKIPEAKEQFAEVVRLRPDYTLGHLNLGVALVKEGRMDDALIQFRETLRLDPQNRLAQQHVQSIQALQGRRPQ